MITIAILVSLIYFIEVCVDPETILNRARDSWISLDTTGIYIVSILSIIILSGIDILVIQLLSFHACLYHKGMTTYDYIVDQSKRASQARAQSRKVRESMNSERQNGAEMTNQNIGSGSGNV
jgi:hypothetical protein